MTGAFGDYYCSEITARPDPPQVSPAQIGNCSQLATRAGPTTPSFDRLCITAISARLTSLTLRPTRPLACRILGAHDGPPAVGYPAQPSHRPPHPHPHNNHDLSQPSRPLSFTLTLPVRRPAPTPLPRLARASLACPSRQEPAAQGRSLVSLSLPSAAMTEPAVVPLLGAAHVRRRTRRSTAVASGH